MTYQSPRIYTYKITFEEVPYYYYGVKKEKYYNQVYWGSPVTHKWCWEFYTPKKQILEIFDYTDEGYVNAQEIEKRLISPVLNDKWCLNENVGGITSSKISRETAIKNWKNGIGLASIPLEQRKEVASKTGKILYEEGRGCFSITPEQRKEINKKTNQKLYEERKGIYSITIEQRREIGKKTGLKLYEECAGIFSLTTEQRKEIGRKNGRKNYEEGRGCFSITPEQRKEINKKTNSQRWECCETGYISTAAGVVSYQKARGINTSKSNRRRIA